MTEVAGGMAIAEPARAAALDQLTHARSAALVCHVDVGDLAGTLGGGGHAFAAGFVADGSLDDVAGRLARLLEEMPAGGRP
jgi:nanoRNase/pAp phosphatase (c-di-AMP/oligoRNAs hydrolase)